MDDAFIIDAVIGVADLDPLTTLFTGFGGWRVLGEGLGPDGRERLLRPGGSGCGIALVQPDRLGPVVRSNAMPWDCGMVFDLYLLVQDMAAAAAAFAAAGWQGYNDPVEYAAKGWRVSEQIVRGPDGICCCLMQRHEPVVDPVIFAHGPIGPVFNMAIVTPPDRHDDAVTRLGGALGWAAVRQGSMTSLPPGNTPNGQPHNLAIEHPRRFTQLAAPDLANPVTLQILSFEGLVGRDLAARVGADARGIRGPRIVVSSLAQSLERAATGGMVAVEPPHPVDLCGLGCGVRARLCGPEGVIIDLVEISRRSPS